MVNKETVPKIVRAAFEREHKINLHHYPIKIAFDGDGALTLEGEVEDVAAKKLAMELAIVVPGVTGIVDRLHVKPAERMADGAVLDLVRDALIEEPALQNCTIRLKSKGNIKTIRESLYQPHGVIQISVKEGIVFLEEHVINLAQKRLAGVLAWWVPGSRDVINDLEVIPPEEDNDEEVTDAVRLVLEKDPFLNADQIRVGTKSAVVTLDGLVHTEAQKEMAEKDAWYVYGVDNVVNNLHVH